MIGWCRRQLVYRPHRHFDNDIDCVRTGKRSLVLMPHPVGYHNDRVVLAGFVCPRQH